MAYLTHEFGLVDAKTGKSILDSGGDVTVVATGTYVKAALYNPDSDYAALANPVAFTGGVCRFAVADTVNSVDLYILCPGGQFIKVTDVKAGSKNEYFVPGGSFFTLEIPFSITDAVANTEEDTGVDLITGMIILPDRVGISVKTLDSGMTIDVGLLSSESGGDADGFIDGISLTTAVYQMARIGFDVGSNATFMDLTGGDQEFTLGALLTGVGTKAAVSEGSNVDTDEGFYLKEPHPAEALTAKSVSYTLSSSTDTAAGIICLGYHLVP